MRKLMLLLMAPGLCFFLLTGSGEQQDSKPGKEKIRGVLDQYVKALKSENVKLLAQLFAEDKDLVSVNVGIPGIVLGPEKLEATARGWFGAVEDIDVTVKNEVIKMNRAGNAAWVAFTLDGSHSFPGRQNRYEYEGMRVTWGLEKRGAKYLIVQAHWSFVYKDRE